MKMVVAYTDHEAFEPIRQELLELGFLSMSLMEASGSVPEAITSGSYRGITMERHVRPKVRIELVVGDDDVSTVVETVCRVGGERTFAVVMPVEAAHPPELVRQAEAAAAG